LLREAEKPNPGNFQAEAGILHSERPFTEPPEFYFCIVTCAREDMQKKKIRFVLLILMVVLALLSCDELTRIDNKIEMLPRLSDYNIFKGNASDLIPSDDYQLYELSTGLFTDYAEKQRLIKIPAGQSLTAISDGLPEFPNGSILVKTFFYYNDARDTPKGKKIIETRLLIKSGDSWNVGTYLWNEEQTDGRLISTGMDKTINWIDRVGKGRVISYHVPGKNECTTCHQTSNAILPIGPKVRNLNIMVNRNGQSINQLKRLMDLHMMKEADLSSFGVLPDWNSSQYTVSERARAYFEINCAHCHNTKGFAAEEDLFFSYELSLDESRIARRKGAIIDNFESGKMPKIGTTIVDKEALELLKTYLDSL
jgi:uncharacterized repeat protein (TIGR03806 family)